MEVQSSKSVTEKNFPLKKQMTPLEEEYTKLLSRHQALKVKTYKDNKRHSMAIVYCGLVGITLGTIFWRIGWINSIVLVLSLVTCTATIAATLGSYCERERQEKENLK